MSDANPTVNRDTPEEAGGYHADVVPGDPVVPITVWRTSRGAYEQPGAIPARLAQRLIGAYTRRVRRSSTLKSLPVVVYEAMAISGVRANLRPR